ncbi:thioredoxin [Saccharomonospora sp. NPDC046836]|uniref:thioredoxin n=1 Tax=Saccharomonospora sp. NPDC046836 TaxID=3156921 RepID=UPI0033D9EB5A
MSPTTVSGEMFAVTDATFEQQVLRHDRPVLVDFWAQWCPPCHMIAPVLADIARDRSGTLTVCKVNTDENVESARRYQIMSAPTLILFHRGQPVWTIVGARPKARLLGELDAVLDRL